MNLTEIQNTEWAQRFKKECPTSYREAINLALKVDVVEICKRDDHSFQGDFVWAIIPDCDTEFWLDACRTKNEAISVCRSMGWQVLK